MASRVGPAVTRIFFPVRSFSYWISFKIYCKSTSGSGIFPAPVSPQARYPLAGSITSIPYRRQIARLSWVIGFSNIRVFMAGLMIFLQVQAKTVVVSISSARPWASLAITLAVAGATKTTSACFARDTCSTENSKFRSKVSTRHLFPVSVSKVMGLIKFTAFFVIKTWTFA